MKKIEAKNEEIDKSIKMKIDKTELAEFQNLAASLPNITDIDKLK